MKSAMRLPFHSFSPGSSRCEHKKTTVISCLDHFKQHGFPRWFRTQRIFSLVTFLKTSRLSPWTCDAWGCSELCAQTRGSPRSPRAPPRSGQAVLGHPVGADSQRRGPPTEAPPGPRQHLARSGGLAASAEQAPACSGWEI